MIIAPQHNLIPPPHLLAGMGGGMQSLDGMGQFPRFGGGGGGSDGSLGDTVSSCVWDLDATLSASYGGSGQTWSNIRSTPADGSSQTAYDFYRGAGSGSSSDDPTFTGSAGSSSAYWSLDGGDFFSLASGTNTTFLKNLHKTTGGSAATIILAMRGSSGSGYFWGTAPSSPGTYAGVYIYRTGTTLLIDQFSTTNYGRSSTTNATNATDQILAIAFDYTAGTLKKASNAHSFTTVTMVKQTTTTDASLTMKIGANGASSTTSGGDVRIYGCYGFNAILSDSELSSIVTALNTRHGRTYA